MAEFSDEKFNGKFLKPEIKRLLQEQSEIKARDEEITERIKEIQNRCDHVFLFTAGGVYEDAYICKYCGMSKWK